MEKVYNLPPGFRFHPTDEELITRYLSPKVLDSTFESTTIVEVDFNKVEPWDLPWKAKIGEKEWYFFCARDRKYPNGSRANRATCSGYWKATGKDKEIFRAKKLVGMKKTLVFYKGRAPRGEKSNWVMHEYRLQGNNSFQNINKIAKSEWVICRVFNKSGEGKNVRKDCRLDSPAMSCDENRKDEGFDHVTCFSNPAEDSQVKSFDEYTPTPDSILSMPDQSMLRVLLESNDTQNGAKTEFSGDIGINTDAFNHELGFKIYDGDDDDQDFPIDCLWNY